MDLIQRSAAWLSERGFVNARREIEWIFAETLGLSRLELYTRFDMPLAAHEVERLRALVTRRGRHEPLAYVLGNQDFRGLRLSVTAAVLVPRPETEELIDLVLRDLPPGSASVLDVGTGSGAIALALKHERGELAVSATDVSAAALALARGNAERLGLGVTFHHGHLATHCVGPFTAVVANLPYIAEDERPLCDPELAFEPECALFPGGDGLGLIRELIADAPRLLAPGAKLWLEHGFRQGQAVRDLAAQSGFVASSMSDSQGHERFTVAYRG